MTSFRAFLIAAFSLVACSAFAATAPGQPSTTTAHGKTSYRPPCTLFRMTVQPGDTAYSMLRSAGVFDDDVMRWLGLNPNADALAKLRPGDALAFCVAPSLSGGERLESLLVSHDGKVAALASPGRIRHEIARVDFKVGRSLTHSLHAHHLSWRLAEAVRSYLGSADDLPHTLPRGTRIAATFYGAPSYRHSRLLSMDVLLHGKHHRIFHFVDSSGQQFLVGKRGHGIKILSMVPPLRHSRLSSGWGWRINPVLKRREFHKGIDLAAPLGTPVRAALNGEVRIAGWHGNYGRMIELRDARGVETRYGHLHRFAHGIHPGVYVHAGQVIGYVGTTGLSTGPHLYFELWEHHRRVDPLITRPVVDADLGPGQRSRFKAFASRLEKKIPVG